jgi:2,3-bisphosphoglycerate-dependent phosphoglycerate mutase
MDHPSRIVLVRHAESERNLAKKGSTFFADDESRRALRGVPDHEVPITAEGWRQAGRTGEALRARFGDFDVVYHSDYRRTAETTEGLLRAFSPEQRAALAIKQNIFIRERDSGYAYDMTTAEAEAAFPWLHEYWRTTGSFFARPPGGESVAQVCERVALFLDLLFQNHRGQRVLVVTHGVTLRAFRFLLERWTHDEATRSLRAHAPKNCSVTVYEEESGQLVLRDYNTVYWKDPAGDEAGEAEKESP